MSEEKKNLTKKEDKEKQKIKNRECLDCGEDTGSPYMRFCDTCFKKLNKL